MLLENKTNHILCHILHANSIGVRIFDIRNDDEKQKVNNSSGVLLFGREQGNREAFLHN